jgi:hypothetical protein
MTILDVPPAIDAVIQRFDRAAEPFTVSDVQQALTTERAALGKLSDAAHLGAWSERLAFSLIDGRTYAGPSPWGTHFCPLATMMNEAGETLYSPDISGADATIVAHWSCRARSVSNPVLLARYADLIWELTPVITNARRDPEMARLAIDSYLAAVPMDRQPDYHDRFAAALRALDLASLIRDGDRVELARAALLRLHRQVMDEGGGPWWFAFDRLITDKNAGAIEEELEQLVADLESLVLRYGDAANPGSFNPHALEDVAKRLIKHYTRLHRGGDVRRLNEAIARGFEHFASLGSAMLASAVLQTAVNAYRDAGLPQESKRVRILMQERIGQSRAEMSTIETQITISRDDMEKFLEEVVVDELSSTFIKIAANFLPNRRRLEDAVQKSLEHAPLMALMPHTIMAGDHVAGKVGSVQDDPLGRLLYQTTMDIGLLGEDGRAPPANARAHRRLGKSAGLV